MERDLALQPNWILWPASTGTVRLLSITTAEDWALPRELFAVRGAAPPSLVGTDALERRGFFAARRAAFPASRLVPVGRPGAVSATTLALTAGGATGGTNALYVSAVGSGEEIVALRRRTDGRVLLVESPAEGARWSRFWTLGRGWPGGSPTPRDVGAIPGLVAARDVPRLFGRPSAFAWVAPELLLRREADRWLGVAWSSWPTALSLLAGGIGAAVGAALLARDAPRGFADALPALGFAAPAAILMTPYLGRGSGPGFFPLHAALLAGGCVVLARGERGMARIATLGIVAAAFAPVESPWSGVLLGRVGSVSGEAVGALIVYVAYALGATRRREGFAWLIPRLLVAAAIFAMLRADPESAALPLLAAAAGEGATATPLLAAVAAPGGLARLMEGGIGVRWRGLTPEWPRPPFVDAGAWIVASPSLALVGLAAILGPATTTPYADRQLARAWRDRPPGRVALASVGIVALASLLRPELATGIPIALASASSALLGDARAFVRRGLEVRP